MRTTRLATLRFTALSLLIPGLAGLIFSAMVSTYYLDTLPKVPAPQELRMAPRNIHGTVVYQTKEEDRKLSAVEYFSVGIFLAGLGVGVVYLEKWGSARTREAEEEGGLSEYLG